MATTQFVKAERLQKLPPYLFAEIDKKKKAALAAGRDVINLGVGDPDKPTPAPIIQSLQKHVENPAFHQYALDQGAPELRQSIAAFCKKRYGLDLDPNSEILPLIGSKEGIAHFPLAVLNPGDISLVPDPCYPVYRSSSMFAGADVYTMPLEPVARLPARPRRHPRRRLHPGPAPVPELPQQPDRRDRRPAVLREGGRPGQGPQPGDRPGRRLQRDVLRPARPQHPPGPRGQGPRRRVPQPLEDLQHDRLAGRLRHRRRPLIAALGQVKANTDSGIFTAIQFAAKTALDEYDTLTPPIRALYKERRDAFVSGLKRIGWDVPTPDATFYVWIPCPEGLHLDRALRPDPRRGRRGDHPRPRLRPDRRRLHPRRPDRRHPPAPPGGRADRQAEALTRADR